MGRRNLKQNYLFAALFLIGLLLLHYLHILFNDARINTNFASGWLLFLTISLSSFYGLKRFLLPFSKYPQAFWRNFHIIIGSLTILIFLFHLNFVAPTGFFERILAAIFLFISLTGVVGIILQKLIPKRLSHNGTEFLFEEIPQLQLKLLNEFEKLVHNSAESGNLSLLSSELLEKLHSHFSNKKNLLAFFSFQGKPSAVIDRELNSLASGNPNSKNITTEILKLVDRKNRLDYSYSNQFILKNWNLLHAPLIAALILFTLLHLFLVYSFRI